MQREIVLASASPSRAGLLTAAGLRFRRIPSDVDEEALTRSWVDHAPDELALGLARAKAEAVAAIGRADAVAGRAEAVAGRAEAVAGRAEAVAASAVAGRAEALAAKAEAVAGRAEAVAASALAGRAEAVAGRAEAADTGLTASDLVLGCDSVLVMDGKAYGKPLTAEAATRRWEAQRGRTAHLVTGHWLIDVATGAATGRAVSTAVTFADASDAEIADYVATGEPLNVAGAFTLEGRAGPLIERIDGDPSNVIGLSLPGLRGLLAELGVTLREVSAT